MESWDLQGHPNTWPGTMLTYPPHLNQQKETGCRDLNFLTFRAKALTFPQDFFQMTQTTKQTQKSSKNKQKNQTPVSYFASVCLTPRCFSPCPELFAVSYTHLCHGPKNLAWFQRILTSRAIRPAQNKDMTKQRIPNPGQPVQ